MRSEIVKKAEHLYEAGKVPEALRCYATSLWRGEEDDTGLLEVWLSDRDLVARAGEQEACLFIASILFTIDRCEEALRERLWPHHGVHGQSGQQRQICGGMQSLPAREETGKGAGSDIKGT